MSGLEHVVMCIDNSDWSRNGDYSPTRLDVQLNTIYDFYSTFYDANQENTLGIITMGGNSVNVKTSLTRERTKIGTSLKEIEKKGSCDLYKGLAMAQLVLKHRENANGSARIIAFVGSPLKEDQRLLRLALMLSKDSISVDIMSFGEMEENRSILNEFISKVNLDNNSHVYELSSFQSFIDILRTPIVGGENNMEFDDPELRRIMEESLRTYQMETAGRSAAEVCTDTQDKAPAAVSEVDEMKAMLDDTDVYAQYQADIQAAIVASQAEDKMEEEKTEKQEKKDEEKKYDELD